MSRASELRDALGAPTALDKDDRSFKEQMEDLGVEIKKTSELKNINWITTRGRAAPLTNKISINRSTISFGSEVFEILSEEAKGEKFQFAVADFQGSKVLIIKTNKTGYKKVQSEKGYIRAGSPALIRKIQSFGLPLGVYKVKKAKGGIICIPEGGATDGR